ncbi:MAG: helicase-related protein [Anaerolineae bacterium]
MSRLKLDSGLLQAILARVPEGFLHISALQRHVQSVSRKTLDALLSEEVGRDGEYFFLRSRIDAEQLRAVKVWARPEFPQFGEDVEPSGKTIAEQIEARRALLNTLPEQDALLLKRITGEIPFLRAERIDNEGLTEVAWRFSESNLIAAVDQVWYDPLRYGPQTIRELLRRDRLNAETERLTTLLTERVGATMSQDEAIQLLGENTFKELIGTGRFSRFSITTRTPPYSMTWIRLRDTDFRAAQQAAQTATRIPDSAWEALMPQAGERRRPGAKAARTARGRLIAYTYTPVGAAKRLGIHVDTIEDAAQEGLIQQLIDPEGVVRFPVFEVERILQDEKHLDLIAALESIDVRGLALVLGVDTADLQQQLRRAHLPTREVTWGQVRGRWGLPVRLQPFKEVLREKLRERKAVREAAEEARRIEAELVKQRRASLRERLVAAFPTWRHEGRAEQRMVLHIGPPNSGKTHHALNALAAAGSGWYLAPLRLLAFEVFERLNQRGVRCNLLTGEEFIPVEGATITAATIEMFNPNRSGGCVVIDEAQMLADPDRGWAWTRALMEARSEAIHVLAPPSGRQLIERLARAADIRLTVQRHERLAEIKVAEEPWSVRRLPPRTILVAFSRQAALRLKNDLERANRSVSIVYGNLPPEVRRKQADRFARGETEICVATDAVGMGLNLPADYVCFYEVQKFDGRQLRVLTPAEVQQIGGRAGRFGLSQAGEVGATSHRDLRLIRQLFAAPVSALSRARVAPTVEDLEMIPGPLSQRLREWAALRSIPEDLRGALEVADMSERTELAAMLTDREVELLGLGSALQLVNAPTRMSSREYWYECAQSILANETLPPPPAIHPNVEGMTLDRLELLISLADIYLWLSQRSEFRAYAPDAEEVRLMRSMWSDAIDSALVTHLDDEGDEPVDGTSAPKRRRRRSRGRSRSPRARR